MGHHKPLAARRLAPVPPLEKQLLIEKDADVGQADNDGTAPLWIACQDGHVDVVRLLIEKDADITQAWNGRMPLDMAKQQGHTEIVRLLEAHGRA